MFWFFEKNYISPSLVSFRRLSCCIYLSIHYRELQDTVRITFDVAIFIDSGPPWYFIVADMQRVVFHCMKYVPNAVYKQSNCSRKTEAYVNIKCGCSTGDKKIRRPTSRKINAISRFCSSDLVFWRIYKTQLGTYEINLCSENILINGLWNNSVKIIQIHITTWVWVLNVCVLTRMQKEVIVRQNNGH